MPNLNAMIANDTIYFNNYSYQIGGGNTSDAEFAVNNSLFAPESEAAYVKYENNDFYGLPFLLKNSGYTRAHAFHGYEGSFWNRRKAYVKQGFDDFTALEDFEQTDMFPMGLSDKETFRQSLEKIKTYEEPFYSFMITVSSHLPLRNSAQGQGHHKGKRQRNSLRMLCSGGKLHRPRYRRVYRGGLKNADCMITP